ncbi:GH12 family glycosyl hydrolase domain-containing protein [Amycolatopsis sp. H20-H5]|uniref:GH12 family glycosyl hydrolase domain-containing protein n=1 Tax=Amycolatopsis sp. H20-H5 TaxID=3046309 RepID=UPI002DBA614B|nr:hypothetical protein [Amycolatopsis sp. H20-H5]MEC3980457.1 hypothetical protein [Amycolatopsis sp. H20-H5]
MRKEACVLAIAALVMLPAQTAAYAAHVTETAATTSLCRFDTASVAGGSYIVQNNEFNSSASECVTTDGKADFTVANSSISNATNGSPGAYPSIYKGCHYGHCTANSGLPVQVAGMTTGKVRTSWHTTQTGAGAYDVAYDIWFNRTPATSKHPDGAEMMVWLARNGHVQPRGSKVATAKLDGLSFDVWRGGPTVSYVLTNSSTSVNSLDIDNITADAVSRGYVQKTWYLIGVEAGFELWQGGGKLTTDSFSVDVSTGATHNR